MPQKKTKKVKATKPQKLPTVKVKQKALAKPKKLSKPAAVKKASPSANGKKKPLKAEEKKLKKATPKAEKKAAPAPAKVDKKKTLHEAVKSPKAELPKQPVVEKEPVGTKVAKKKSELVLVVPAAKGAALLGRESKKKSKNSESSVSSKKRCREPGCEQEFLLSGYCRLHYIKNWRKIKRKESILASGQLNNYVEELVSKYPDKYLDVIRQDLATEKEWVKVVVDLELESSDEEGAGDEDMEGVAEGVRRSDRDFDDDTDSF